MNTRILVFLAVIALTARFAAADVRLPAIISDNMVIQADSDVSIWGWAASSEQVTVSIGGQKQFVTAGADGKWMVKLKAMEASETSIEMAIAGKNTITVKNILVGQVWLGSGQSNMEMPVAGWSWEKQMDRGVMNAAQEVKNASYPKIRLFTVQIYAAISPVAECYGKWVECSPETVSSFSATEYFFGREVYKKLKQPVGLINSSAGGTIIETWMSMTAIKAEPELAPILQRYEDMLKKYPNGQTDYDKVTAQWKKDARAAAKAAKPAPPEPIQPLGMHLYNGMIAPLIPYAIKGVIWYQGESNANAGRAKQYRKLFPELISDWRAQWQQGNFAFYFVQLADFFNHQPQSRPVQLPSLSNPERSDWPELREAQTMTLSLPNTGMAVAMDIGDPYDIHAKNKQEVGRRLALWALAKSYGFKDLVYSGPLYKNMKIEKNKIRIYFDDTGSGLASGSGPLKGFSIAGKDRKFVWADVAIDNNTVVVWSEKIDQPVAVRYGWAKWIECNLFNKEKLPASPFRTDDWQGVADNAK